MNHDPMPVIIGAPRSGTTLLRFMIDAHPQIAIPPETGFLATAVSIDSSGAAAREDLFRLVTNYPEYAPAWTDFGLQAPDFRKALELIAPFDVAEGCRAFYRLYARTQDKPRYGDKTPMYCDHISSIAALLPEAHFVHIIRDGRDASLSLRRMWFAPGQDMQTLALYWRGLVRRAREAGPRCGRYLEVRYEDLILNPQATLAAICQFTRLDFDPCMLRYWERTPQRLLQHGTRHRSDGTILSTHEQRLGQQQLTMLPPQPDRIAVWKEEMTPAERQEFTHYAGDTLEELGYEL